MGVGKGRHMKKFSFYEDNHQVYDFFSLGVPMIPAVIPVAIDRDFVVAYSHEMPRKIEL